MRRDNPVDDSRHVVRDITIGDQLGETAASHANRSALAEVELDGEYDTLPLE